MTQPAESNSESDKKIEAEASTPDAASKPDLASKPDADTSATAKAAEPEKVEPKKAEPAKAEPAKADASDVGKALAPAGVSPVNPFIAAAAEDKIDETIVPPRTIVSRMLDYSAHAAIVVGLIGFAWTVSDHVVGKPASKTEAPAAAAALAPQPVDEMTQLKLANQKMHDEIKALRASVETLRTNVRRDTTPEQVRMLSAGLETMKGSVASSSAAIAQLNSKMDKLQPAKVQQLSERVGRLEHQALDQASTGSIAKSESMKSDTAHNEPKKADFAATPPKPPVKPTTLASNAPEAAEADRPQVISGWVVRDVYQGVALIEGRRGTMEVTPGVTIPGAGVVKSIERHGNGWTVTTSKGQLAAAATAPQREHDYGRGGSDYGRGYGRRGYGYPYGY